VFKNHQKIEEIVKFDATFPYLETLLYQTNIMIKSLLLITAFFIAGISFSQSSHDSRLLERYSDEELTELKNSEPEEYAVLVNGLERGISIGKIPTEKGKDIQFDGNLDIDPNENHTYISLGIDLKENKYQYFKITGTNMMIGVLPKSLLK